jgi:holo-[acyl-carrier protein] synthase
VIFGIGSDILQVSRIQASVQRQRRLPYRILGYSEVLVYESRLERNLERGLRYLATRFAAKEAFSKACGLGMRSPMTWRSIEILNLPSGAPCVVPNNAMAQWLSDRALITHVSITDEIDYVAAFVVIECVPKRV